MINIAICDDDKIFVQELKELLEKYFCCKTEEYSIQIFRTGKEVLDHKGFIELLFLDIEMHSLGGFEVAEIFKKRLELGNIKVPKIIFLTNHDEVIKKAFRVNAFRFLTKDNFKDEIECCIKDFLKERENEKFYEVIFEHEKITIKQSNIQYITAQHNGTDIWMDQITCFIDKSLSEWMNLLDPESFVICHKSSIVNLAYIDYINKYVYLYNGNKILVSRRKKTELIKKYNHYIYINGR